MRLLTLWLESKQVFDQCLVRGVWGPFIRKNPCHACFTGSVDEPQFSLFRSVTTQGNDQGILSSECLNECLGLVVVDLLRNHAFWQLILAVEPRDGRDSVLGSLEQTFSYRAAAVTPSLRSSADNSQMA